MSFGFSVGDFLAAATLIKNVISALQGSASLEYRELELELHGLQRALEEIERLQPSKTQEMAVNAVKVAALMCWHPIDEFHSKLKKYERLSGPDPQKKQDMVKGWGRKAQWNVSMPDEVQKLRAYIAAHVGSLNMRLTTLGLEAMTISKTEISTQVEVFHNALERQKKAVSENTAKVDSLGVVIMGQVLPQLQTLVDLAGKVWKSNLQIMEYFMRAQCNSATIDVSHTWFQEPWKFEDALGRVLPIPAEYGWTKFTAIIQDQFRTGPGSLKVFADEFEVFTTDDSSKLITEQTLSLLQPGTGITMALVVGRYDKIPENLCPKPGCKSRKLMASTAGGYICGECKTWLGKAQKSLPRPLRLFSFENLEITNHVEGRSGSERKQAPRSQRNFVNEMREYREERKWYKNLRIDRRDISDAVRASAKFWDPNLTTPPRSQQRQQIVEQCIVTPEQAAFKINFDSQNSQQIQPEGSTTETWDRVLQIVCEEMGCEIGELKDEVLWAEIGMDSLIGLIVLGRIGESLHREVPGSWYLDCPSVGESRKLFAKKQNKGTEL